MPNNLGLNIWFSLTRGQQRKLSNAGYCHQFLDDVPLNVFGKITDNKDLRRKFFRYKFRRGLRLVA